MSISQFRYLFLPTPVWWLLVSPLHVKDITAMLWEHLCYSYVWYDEDICFMQGGHDCSLPCRYVSIKLCSSVLSISFYMLLAVFTLDN